MKPIRMLRSARLLVSAFLCSYHLALAGPTLFMPPESSVEVAINKGAGRGAKAFFTECAWAGKSYTNLVVQQMPGRGPNLIGLRFLARHLVTLDFPKRTMYLKQTTTEPLAGDIFVGIVQSSIGAPLAFLEKLSENAQLPARAGSGKERLFCVYHSEGDANCYTAVFQRIGDGYLDHYTVNRGSKDGAWKLQERR
jgi:hypothetical protein